MHKYTVCEDRSVFLIRMIASFWERFLNKNG